MGTPRAVINQVFQMGAESQGTPGTGGSANNRLGTFNSQIAPVASGAFGLFRPSGSKYVGQVVPTDTYAEGAYTDTIDYNTVPFLFSGNVGWADPGAANADGAYTWRHTPVTFGPGTTRSFVVQEGEAGAVYNYSFVMVPDLALRFMRTGASQITGRVLGKRGAPGTSLTAATGNYYGHSISGLKTGIWSATDWAGLSSPTRFSPYPVDLSFRHNGIFAPWFAMDDSVISYAGALPQAADTGVQISVLADVDTNDIRGLFNYANMDLGNNIFLRIYNQGPLIAGATNFSLEIMLSLQISSPPRRANQGPLRVWQWDAICKPGPTWPPFDVTVVNTLPGTAIPAIV